MTSVCAASDPPVEVIVVVLGFTPEIKKNKTQEEGEDEEAKTATLHLKDREDFYFTHYIFMSGSI